MRFLMAAFLLLSTFVAHSTTINVARSINKNILRDYPNGQVISVYVSDISYDASSDAYGTVAYKVPQGKDFILTQACASSTLTGGGSQSGDVRVFGVYVAYASYEDPEHQHCRSHMPGMLVPQGTDIYCYGRECTVTGILR